MSPYVNADSLPTSLPRHSAWELRSTASGPGGSAKGRHFYNKRKKESSFWQNKEPNNGSPKWDNILKSIVTPESKTLCAWTQEPDTSLHSTQRLRLTTPRKHTSRYDHCILPHRAWLSTVLLLGMEARSQECWQGSSYPRTSQPCPGVSFTFSPTAFLLLNSSVYKLY